MSWRTSACGCSAKGSGALPASSCSCGKACGVSGGGPGEGRRTGWQGRGGRGSGQGKEKGPINVGQPGLFTSSNTDPSRGARGSLHRRLRCLHLCNGRMCPPHELQEVQCTLECGQSGKRLGQGDTIIRSEAGDCKGTRRPLLPPPLLTACLPRARARQALGTWE